MVAELLLVASAWVMEPPERYDRPAHGVTIQHVGPAQVRRFCGDPRALACAYRHARGCTIIAPHGTTRGSRLYRHERAHCNGWPGHHPR